MSNSVRPYRWQPTRLPHPWDSPGKNTGVGCHFLLQSVKVKSESEVAQSCPTLSNPMDCSHQAPPPMGFSRQEYWSGCHWKTKKLMWFDLLWSSLYCDGLGASLQDLWSVSINCKMTTMVKLTSHLSPYTVTTVLLIIFPRLCITPLWLTCFMLMALGPFQPFALPNLSLSGNHQPFLCIYESWFLLCFLF